MSEKTPHPYETRKLREVPLEHSITSCVGSRDTFSEEDMGNLRALGAIDVEFYDSKEEMANKGHRNAGETTYVISPINGEPKLSDEYRNCTGLAATGIDKVTDEPISIMSHQDPRAFLNKQKAVFEVDMRRSLMEFRAKCVPGTIDAVLFGGAYVKGASAAAPRSNMRRYTKDMIDDYKDSIRVLGRLVEATLGIDPQVAIGPNKNAFDADQDAVLDTKHRRLYIIRPGQFGFENNVSFPASQIDRYFNDDSDERDMRFVDEISSE